MKNLDNFQQNILIAYGAIVVVIIVVVTIWF